MNSVIEWLMKLLNEIARKQRKDCCWSKQLAGIKYANEWPKKEKLILEITAINEFWIPLNQNWSGMEFN